VETAGLTTKESTHFPAEGMSCAAFRHGPFEMCGPQTAVVVYEGLPATREFNLRLAADVEKAGGRALVIRQDSPDAALRLPAAPASILPVLEILPAQMITLAIARLHGHNAGVFSFGSKVTTVE
jgi:glutamine---fructose-6-phosphate transaminase (isomerizing)